MDRHSKLVIAFLLWMFSGLAFAGYAVPSNPAGFTAAADGGWQYLTASNDAVLSKVVRISGPIVNVGGTAVRVPAAMRFAANVGLFAARGAFFNPWLQLGIAVAPPVIDWLNSGGFRFGAAGVVEKTDPSVCTVSPCYGYKNTYAGVNSNVVSPTLSQGCLIAIGAQLYGYPITAASVADAALFKCSFTSQGGTAVFPISRISVPPSSATWLPATQSEFETSMADKPFPDELPKLLPFPLPVELPILNPSPDVNPVPQPLRLPQGAPVPVPSTNPQQYRQPVIDLVPSPTVDSPFRLELVPRDILSNDPTPLPEKSSVTVTVDPATAPDRSPDLCEKNPGILACQTITLDSIDPTPVKNKSVQLSINKDSGWGPSNGSCPSPKTAVVMGVSLSVPFTLLCDVATSIRPLIIGLAWLSAALTFFGFSRKGD